MKCWSTAARQIQQKLQVHETDTIIRMKSQSTGQVKHSQVVCSTLPGATQQQVLVYASCCVSDTYIKQDENNHATSMKTSSSCSFAAGHQAAEQVEISAVMQTQYDVVHLAATTEASTCNAATALQLQGNECETSAEHHARRHDDAIQAQCSMHNAQLLPTATIYDSYTHLQGHARATMSHRLPKC